MREVRERRKREKEIDSEIERKRIRQTDIDRNVNRFSDNYAAANGDEKQRNDKKEEKLARDK